MQLRDQKIITALETIWQEAEKLYEQQDPARYVLKLEEAWNVLPWPRESYEESYDIAFSIADTYFALRDYPNMLKWAKTLQHCDRDRNDEGERTFMLGKALFENGMITEATEYFATAMQASAGRVFEGEDEKYLHVFEGVRSVVEEELPEAIYQQVEVLSEEGNELADDEQYDAAIAKFTAALQLLPDPRHEWEACTWLYASIGDMYFFKADYAAAAHQFYEALNGPDAQAVGFVHLRLGECLYEIKQEEKAVEHLLRAYMLEGPEIFAEEDSRYFDFLKGRVEL
ncbi:hypothetical protein FHW36_11298 [Chitinophaga polysaccharea]|uniref:Uncharacterized protein n=1 Tax=Chitinophaga polysaccharea TaxID=1293035 RepID=A0A561P6B0_9BACT|nr:hypothetical protein [Chitinophaga polysaccharea]TWF33657.1 hypothetical protein FHW36_11298 [Chitinophaga polysaccharea]